MSILFFYAGIAISGQFDSPPADLSVVELLKSSEHQKGDGAAHDDFRGPQFFKPLLVFTTCAAKPLDLVINSFLQIIVRIHFMPFLFALFVKCLYGTKCRYAPVSEHYVQFSRKKTVTLFFHDLDQVFHILLELPTVRLGRVARMQERGQKLNSE